VGVLAGQPSNTILSSGDGVGTSVAVNRPHGLALDVRAGGLVFCELGMNRVRRVSAAGVVTALAGSYTGGAGFADGLGPVSLFSSPWGVAPDGAGGSVALNSAASTAALDLTAGSLSASSTATLNATGALNVRITGGSSSNFGALTLKAPSVNLDSQAGGIFKVDTPTVSLASRNSLSVTQAATGSTTLSLNSSAGNFAFTSLGALSVSNLSSGSGTVALTASSGDITLGSITQALSGSLSLTALAGKVTGASSTNRSIGALSVMARDGLC
jgi:hypothetical protein